MSLQDIRSECSDMAGQLQPYVDSELTDGEEEQVARHLEACRPCRTAVSEQMWVRTALRAVERESAPPSLRSRVVAALDEVDREAAVPAGLWTRTRARLRELGRGGLVMIPAGAVAASLFLVARYGVEATGEVPAAALGSAAVAAGTKDGPPTSDVMQAVSELRPQVDFPIQVANPAQQVQLVSARRDDVGPAAHPGAQLRYRVFHNGSPTDVHLVDRQRAAAGPLPSGRAVDFRGRRYVLGGVEGDTPAIHFVSAGVAHLLVLERPGAGRPSSLPVPSEGPIPADYTLLLRLADQMVAGHPGNTPPR